MKGFPLCYQADLLSVTCVTPKTSYLVKLLQADIFVAHFIVFFGSYLKPWVQD